jgi:predicted DNA-binding transcriptional regulator AlpA
MRRWSRSFEPIDRLLPTWEAAEMIGSTPGTLRNWRMKGKGPKAIRVGGRAKYRQSELEAWIEEQETGQG